MFFSLAVTCCWLLVRSVDVHGSSGETRIFDEEKDLHSSSVNSDLKVMTPSQLQMLAGLYDQHQWSGRLHVVEGFPCRKEMKNYLWGLRNGSIWAAKMYDASGRYNGQFFVGNDFWLGSSVLCSELQNSDTNVEIPPFSTHYFVAKVRIGFDSNFTSAVRQVHLGLCLPESCTVQDVRKLLSEEPANTLSMDIAGVKRVPGSYNLLRDPKFEIIGISASITVLLIIVASVVEILIKRKRNKRLHLKVVDSERHSPMDHSLSKEHIIGKADEDKTNFPLRLLLVFSAITNSNKILSIENKPKDSITCLNGLRVISISWIILVHTYLEVFGVAKNKFLRTLIERNFTYQTIANATFSVDTFFFISGFLLTLGFFRNESNKLNKEPFTKSIIQCLIKFMAMLCYRFVRLTPPYLFVLGVNEVVMRYVHNNSVFTPAVIDHITCEKYWWRNALYINNFFPQAEFCMLWSWYITNDSQFFVIASIILIVAIRGKKPLKYAVGAVGILLVTSWTSTFVIAIRYNYVARVQEPFALFDELYDKPWLRIGPYLIGMIMGYVMFRLKGKIMLTPPVVVIGWALSLLCLSSLVYGLGKHGLVVPASAFYVALGHTAWALSLAWITVACSSGYGGPFNVFLSCKFFVPLSRLTYGAYLVHPIVMFLTSFSLDGSLQIHQIIAIVIFFGNVVLSFGIAFVVSLVFEAPAINLIKIIPSGSG
ncbi:nose resistant to fluoxetine protein 6-like [Euwallacea fornicatus]|uniref:nose resistant to fluoxetine protein 6-like n=1 Tax=Euwallacea fornicatus TaxID=995702 RepID=UPI00338E8C93